MKNMEMEKDGKWEMKCEACDTEECKAFPEHREW